MAGAGGKALTGVGKRIVVRDVTLRDGEQTPHVAFSPAEKLQIAKHLLLEVRVDKVEVASARVSDGEAQAVAAIMGFAKQSGCERRVEILAYSDAGPSIDWAVGTGCLSVALLTKGSERHCRAQLRMPPSQHFQRIARTIRYAEARAVEVNGAYLEDWSQGARDGEAYVHELISCLQECGVRHIYLADTLAVLTPDETKMRLEALCQRFPSLSFEFHTHNDYGLAVANSLAAIAGGATGIHASVNGLGERAGNTDLASVVAALHDHTPHTSEVNETALTRVSAMVEAASGKVVAANAPISGADVFTQTAGIHADGDAKDSLYETRLRPERFGRKRDYALGKLSGVASVERNLSALGLALSSDEQRRVLRRVVELGDKKHVVAATDLPFIISDVLGRPRSPRVKVLTYRVVESNASRPHASVSVSVDGRRLSGSSSGTGAYDAIVRAIGNALVATSNLVLPKLLDYRVRIPPGGGTAALVQTVAVWASADGPIITTGVDADQLAAAVIATEKMLCVLAERSDVEPEANEEQSLAERQGVSHVDA